MFVIVSGGGGFLWWKWKNPPCSNFVRKFCCKMRRITSFTDPISNLVCALYIYRKGLLGVCDTHTTVGIVPEMISRGSKSDRVPENYNRIHCGVTDDLPCCYNYHFHHTSPIHCGEIDEYQVWKAWIAGKRPKDHEPSLESVDHRKLKRPKERRQQMSR